MTNKKFTSDRQRIAEMQRRGIKPGTDMVGLVAGVRAKQGGGTTARIKPAAAGKPTKAAKLNTGPAKPKSLQSKDAQSDRLDVAGRKKKAKALLEMSKPARKAVRVSLLAQRAGFGGAGVSTDGRKKGSSSSAIANIDSGRMRLISDSGKRKGKLTAGQRQANERTMITSGKSLQARLRTKQIGAKVKGMGGDRKTMAAAAKPKSVITKAKPKAVAAVPKAAKLPREQRLARAKVTAKRIDQKLKAKADETGAAFAERRRISSRASSKARTAAFEKEAVAGKASATALRASQRSNARVTRLAEEQGKYAQAARGAATKPAAKPAPKSPEPAVKIAKRKPKTPAEIAAGREADRREMASILRKPARWLAPTPVAKPATLSTKAKTPKFTTEQSGRVRRAALGGGRTAIVRKNSAVIINAKGEPIMTRKGLPNITAGKKYAANPNARGPRLMGRDRSEASPSRGYIRTSKPTGTIGKPKGLKPGSIKPKAAATKPAVRRKSVGTISEAKAGRIISRIDANRPGLRRASGSARKTANAIRTQQRATDFALAASARGRKQGKNLSVNQSLQRAIKNASAKRKPRSMR